MVIGGGGEERKFEVILRVCSLQQDGWRWMQACAAVLGVVRVLEGGSSDVSEEEG